ncbi:MAG: L,D-transpeptidase family protein [Mesorhizobium sp.]|nr:L,D-transpeptidase family protein [Mesorhizobium sp.]MBL8579641.1 L,D-transpeptidase family protein [Mesorhizobium sp.]
MNVSAFAAPPVPASPVSEVAAVVQVATKAEEEAKKKKKTATNTKNKKNTKTAAKPLTEAEKKAAAKEKAQQEKLAKAKAEKEKLAKAKAEREKKLAADKAERDKKTAAAKVEREKKLAAQKVEREKKAAAAKVEREKMVAERAKAAEERKIRLAKEADERKIAREKAAEERKVAREKAAEERRQVAEAKAKAAEDRRLAQIRAEEERQAQIAAAAEVARQAEISRLVAMDVVQTGNNSELRSEAAVQAAPKQTGLFAGLFGGKQVAPKAAMLPETRALDAALEQREAKKKFTPKPQFMPQVVEFSGYPTGTIVVDTANYYLYLVESPMRARRYGIAVGKEGLQYKGSVKVGDKQEWPRWIPTKEMIAREPAKYSQYAEGMPGGGQNPLGARAIYLYNNGKDTYLRIHGTIAPESIGTSASNGCFRMINDDVMDLYRRVPIGTNVVVL